MVFRRWLHAAQSAAWFAERGQKARPNRGICWRRSRQLLTAPRAFTSVCCSSFKLDNTVLLSISKTASQKCFSFTNFRASRTPRVSTCTLDSAQTFFENPSTRVPKESRTTQATAPSGDPSPNDPSTFSLRQSGFGARQIYHFDGIRFGSSEDEIVSALPYLP